MLRSGLVSITFRKLAVEEIVHMAATAGLDGLEWGGDTHVPHGNVARARTVRALTEEAGLKVAAYGSYYRAGVSSGKGLSFSAVLDSAVALGAPLIRVWAGDRASNQHDAYTYGEVVNDLRRIAALAASARVEVALEYHANTLTDTPDSAQRILEDAAHPNLFTLWQPHHGREADWCVSSLRKVLPKLRNLHVFHWFPGPAERHSLNVGADRWRRYLAVAAQAPGERYALLEFVKGDEPSQMLLDAVTLRRWLAEINPRP